MFHSMTMQTVGRLSEQEPAKHAQARRDLLSPERAARVAAAGRRKGPDAELALGTIAASIAHTIDYVCGQERADEVRAGCAAARNEGGVPAGAEYLLRVLDEMKEEDR